MRGIRLGFAVLSFLVLATSAALTQDTAPPAAPTQKLSLDAAIELAKKRNGILQSASLAVRSAKANKNVTYTDFLPSIGPSYSYQTGKTRYQTGGVQFNPLNERTASGDLSLNWQLLDNGTRFVRFASAKTAYELEQANYVNTLRETLFSVHQQYFDTLRSVELLRVQAAQEELAQNILERTKVRVEVGDAARKDVLQANADYLNSKVNVLAAQNDLARTMASFKALIGWESRQEDPELDPSSLELADTAPTSLEVATEEALSKRPDLAIRREQIRSARLSLKSTELSERWNFSVDATLRKNFADDVYDRSQISLSAYVPLWNGGRAKEAINARKFDVQARESEYGQAIRDAQAEIESAYKELAQNRERLSAADTALEAARVNYTAVEDAQELGASDLVELITARVSLVTAEVNRVQAYYDLLTSEVRWNLVTGEDIRGE